jgi:hypothetical protein
MCVLCLIVLPPICSSKHNNNNNKKKKKKKTKKKKNVFLTMMGKYSSRINLARRLGDLWSFFIAKEI